MTADLTQCDREPIHIPGSIQPHGMLLLVDPSSFAVRGGAGPLDQKFGDGWLDTEIDVLLQMPVSERLRNCRTTRCEIGWSSVLRCDLAAFRSDGLWLLQIEPTNEPEPAVDILGWMEEVGVRFERTTDLAELCQRAADSFSELIGYDRVMIYQFLDDDAGVVVAEATHAGTRGFLNHHFPASDIPKQARALYVRNRVRVIPDVSYEPAPLIPAELAHVDLSDVELRSVSPIHLQYLKNMGVAASASVSIVRDGLLWGLVACHHHEPRGLTMAQRRAAQLVASGLARQIGAKEEAEAYRERIRIRAEEDALTSRLSGDKELFDLLADASDSLRRMFAADGFAIVCGSQVHREGQCPGIDAMRAVAGWAKGQSAGPFHTTELGKFFPFAVSYADLASGLMSITLSAKIPIVLMWLRAEAPQHVEWAGNPHKAVELGTDEILTPRASFEAWSEVVRGKSAPWTAAEIEGAHRLVAKLFEIRQNRRLQELADSLSMALADKERVLEQKELLLKEVNHRVQNSIQLVISFLSMQGRASGDGVLAEHLAEAQKRLSAVSLVHRRLYTDDNVQTVDLSRYLGELVQDLASSMDPEWARQITTDLAPVLIVADDAIRVGLIFVELIINAQKYAYDGMPGPISVVLEQQRNRFRLIVADRGKGRTGERQGFGSRMLAAMVQSLSGTIEDDDSRGGLRVVLVVPIRTPKAGYSDEALAVHAL